MNLWEDFDLKFDPILQVKMAKISPKIRRIDLEFSPRDNTL